MTKETDAVEATAAVGGSPLEAVVSYKRYTNGVDFHVVGKLGAILGSLSQSATGIYYFWPQAKIGAISEAELRAIADKIAEENYINEAMEANVSAQGPAKAAYKMHSVELKQRRFCGSPGADC